MSNCISSTSLCMIKSGTLVGGSRYSNVPRINKTLTTSQKDCLNLLLKQTGREIKDGEKRPLVLHTFIHILHIDRSKRNTFCLPDKTKSKRPCSDRTRTQYHQSLKDRLDSIDGQPETCTYILVNFSNKSLGKEEEG